MPQQVNGKEVIDIGGNKQIMTLYKADTQGMLFADDDKNDSSVKDTANAS